MHAVAESSFLRFVDSSFLETTCEKSPTPTRHGERRERSERRRTVNLGPRIIAFVFNRLAPICSQADEAGRGRTIFFPQRHAERQRSITPVRDGVAAPGSAFTPRATSCLLLLRLWEQSRRARSLESSLPERHSALFCDRSSIAITVRQASISIDVRCISRLTKRKPPGSDMKEKLTLRINRDVKARAKNLAARRGVSVSQMVEDYFSLLTISEIDAPGDPASSVSEPASTATGLSPRIRRLRDQLGQPAPEITVDEDTRQWIASAAKKHE